MSLSIAYAYMPSSRAGHVNIFIAGKGWMEVDPSGNISFDSERVDGNYQQFKPTGPLTVEITPRDDQTPPFTMTFVLYPA